jgi:hypothetical protein
MTVVALTWGDIDLAISYHSQALAAAAHTGRTYWALEVGQALLNACRGDLDESQRRLDPLPPGTCRSPPSSPSCRRRASISNMASSSGLANASLGCAPCGASAWRRSRWPCS